MRMSIFSAIKGFHQLSPVVLSGNSLFLNGILSDNSLFPLAREHRNELLPERTPLNCAIKEQTIARYYLLFNIIFGEALS